MSTLSRSAQARPNGAKSEGPRTPEGKTRPSLNTYRHGRKANHATLLSNEDPAAFDDLALAYVQRLGPLDSVEACLARELAAIDWLLARYRAVATRRIVHEVDPQAPMIEATNRHPQALARLYRAATSLVRHETALQAARRNTLSTLQQLRRIYPVTEKATQIIDPKPLTTEFHPRNEPGANPA